MPPARPAARARSYQRGPHLVRRGAVWYARGGAFGKDGVSLRTEDRAEAERRFAAGLANPDDRRGARARESPPETTLPALIDRWLASAHGYSARTLQTHTNRILAWAAWCETHGVSLASEVTHGRVDEWVGERAQAVGRRTVNRDLRTVKVCLRWAATAGLCAPCKPIADRRPLREPARSVRRVVPDPQTLAEIVRAVAPGRPRAAIEALVATGLRIEELRRCHVGWLRPEGLEVQPEAGPAAEAWATKGYAARTIPLAPEALAVVRRYLAVAVGRRGQPITERTLLLHLHTACDAVTAARVAALGHEPTEAEREALAVPRCGLHDLRRAFVTEAFRAGVPLVTIARWVGHADVRTTEGYLASYGVDGAAVAPVALALRK